MDITLSALVLLTSATIVLGQRPFFAGTKPIGFPEVIDENDGLGDRFGEVDGTTPKLPVEAHGDWDYVNRISKLPVDKQPFWFINWQAYEAQRKNPQTYPQRPNEFIDSIPNSNANSGVANLNSGTSNSNSEATSNSGSAANRFAESDSNSNVKPVALSTSGNKTVEIKPHSEVKPVVTEATNSNKKEEMPKYESTTVSNSETGNKFEEVAPLVPRPIEPESTIGDGLKLKADSSADKKVSLL